MTRLLAAILGAALGVAITASAVSAAPLALKRGVGVHEWLNWSPVDKDGSYHWPPYRSIDQWLASSRPIGDWPAGDQFVRIRKLGFDFIRLTVDPGPLAASDGDRRKQALDIVAKAVRHVTAAGLKVVLDLHGVTQVPAYSMKMIYDGADSAGVARYRAMVGDVARMLVGIGTDKVALEPYNEPAYYPCNGGGTDDWQKIMTATVQDIRAVSRDLTIVATGNCGGGIDGLVGIDPDFDDPNILYSFHMYEPIAFTHQRSDEPGGFVSGFPWPAESGSPQSIMDGVRAHMQAAGLDATQQKTNIEALRKPIAKYFAGGWTEAHMQERFAKVIAWGKSHAIEPDRLFMGEFGVIRMSDDGRQGAYDADRLHWLETVRKTAERHDITWSVWEYSNPYGMTVIQPKGPAVPDQDLLNALGLAGTGGG